MQGNYIKLDRSILEWCWYTDINTCRLFIHMLLRANWKDGYFRQTVVPRGSFVSSVGKLAESTGLSEREVRTAISHLKSTGEVTSRSTNKYTVFSIKNYDKYQSTDKLVDMQETNERQTNDNQSTTIEEGKKGRREEEREGKSRFSPPTTQDVSAYCEEKGISGFDVERFIDFYSSKGWMVGKNKMKDWKAAVRNWARQDKSTKPAAPKKNSFTSYPQRSYDYGELEEKLLNAEKRR